MSQLILDGHKLNWHMDRVEAWEAGERIAPVSVDMALSRACQASCRGCYAQLQEPQERSNVKVDDAYRLLDDFAEIGVRGVSLISDGESTLSPAYVPFIKRAAELGVDVGNATNGWIFTTEMLEEILPHLKWVRFTVLAGRPQSYVSMMHHDTGRSDVFWKAMFNISEAVRIKRQKNLDVTLGIQTFVTPKDADEILAFAQLALDLGVDYGIMKHTSDDEYNTMGVDYDDYDKLFPVLQQAEGMSTDRTLITCKWQKLHMRDKPSYKRMYATQFLLQISGSGLVAPSGMFFNARYSKFHIGNYTEERFLDIWKSDRYWDVQHYLAGPYFDAATMMGTLPIQHHANVALDKHVKGVERLERVEGFVPEHVNFL